MAWPITRASSFSPDDVAWNEVVNALSTWGGDSNAGGFNLAGLGRVFVGDGSAALPSATLTNSPTTGWFRGGPDILSIATAGVERAQFKTGEFNFTTSTDIVMRVRGAVAVTDAVSLVATNTAFSANIPLEIRATKTVFSIGRLFYATPNSAPTDSDLIAASVTAYLNEAGNALTFRVKYTDGITLKSGTIALT